MSSEQTAWVKEGTAVRWKGGGRHGTIGKIVKVPGGLAVRYAGESLTWSGNIAESWVPCVEGDLQQTGPATPSEPTRIEQAAWVKAGVTVLRRGCGPALPRTIGVVVESQGALAVRYEGCEDLWSGDIASSWEPIDGVVPVATQPVMPDGGPCAKPQPVADVESLSTLLERAAADQAGWPDTVSTRHTLRQLWERLDAEIGAEVRRLPYLVAKVREADAAATGTKASNMARTNGDPVPPSTMAQILARLDAIDVALKPLALTKQVERVVDMSRVVPFHLARTRGATSAGVADPAELPCPTCGIIRWGQCRAVEGLDPLPANGVPPATSEASPTSAPKRYVQAHLARDEAAAASGWTDSYMAPCSRCGAARWEGCTAVDDEPDFGEPVPRVHVRLWNTEGTPHFMSIPWPQRDESVARGLFEVCGALVPPMPGVLRPGLRPVARTWESLDVAAEPDYWHTSVKGYLDGTLEERTVGAVEWAALGAMVRVFGLQRKA